MNVNAYNVEACVQVNQLKRNGSSINLKVYDGNSKKIGEIFIGRGSFIWVDKNKPKDSKDKRFTWSNFAKLMNSLDK